MLAESIKLAIEALGRNALRTTLTGLGILIGVGAVITMVAIGQGASMNVRSEIARLGSDLLTLNIGQQKRGGRGASIQAQAFAYADIEAIRREVRGLRHVAPLASRSVRISARRENWNSRAIGTENGYFSARSWPLAHGRLFSESETYNGKPVCVIGETIRQRLFADGDAMRQHLRVAGVVCSVIGVLQARGQSGGSEDDDDIVAVPFDMFQRRIQGKPDITSIVMSAYPTAARDRLHVTLKGLMRERRGLAAGETEDFSLVDMRQVSQSMTAATRTLTVFLGAIAAVSLLVGGIGIMNIMLVSVTERTREIGVRLTIGALPSQVRLQFLCESVLLTSAGGMLGIVAGLTAAAIASPWLGIPFVFDATVVIGAVLVSSVLGIGFGYAPAAKAAALDPVEALRHS